MRNVIGFFSLVALVIYCLLSMAADQIEGQGRKAARAAEQRVEEVERAW